MNKKNIIVILICICAILTIGYLILNLILNGNNILKLNKKISKIEDSLLNDKELNFSKNSYVVFISISDIDTKAYVINDTGYNLKNAISNAKEKAKDIVKKYKVSPEIVKIDVVQKDVKVTKDTIEDEIRVADENCFRKGITLDEDYNTALLESELNANEIIDYKNGKIDLEKLNKYLESNNKKIDTIKELPKTFKTFSTISYVYNNEKVYKISSDIDSIGIRKIETIEDLTCLELIENATDYLLDSVKENGSFVYEYNPKDDKESDTYNILRHNGTVWSMIESYKLSNSKELKEKISSGVKYVVDNCVKYKDDNTAYIIEPKNSEIKLGANGIGILMLVDYMETFKTDEYKDLANCLGNGIASMQEKNGSYYHVLMYPEFSRYEKTRTVYYDGEATFALAKLYGYTKDKKWLDMAEKAMNYFCKNDYVQYKDHWIEYSVAEVIKYSPKEEYIRLGLDNISKNLHNIVNLSKCAPINLELLTKGLEIYDIAKENNIDTKDFSVEDLIDSIYYRAFYQLNGIYFDEVAMYYKNPERIIGAFYTRENDLKIRIDDIQHNINGYYNLYNSFNLIKKYSKEK